MATSKLSWRNWPMSVKLVLAMTVLVISVVAGVTLQSIRREQQSFQSELERQAELMLDALAVTSADSLYFLRRDSLVDVAVRLVEGREVARARFYDQEGRPLVDSEAPQQAISYRIDPFGQRLAQSTATVVQWQYDRLEAGQAVIAGGQTLGAVSIALSTEALEAKVAAVRNQGVFIAILALTAGTLLALLISRSVVHPLHDLVVATESVAGGDLSYRIAVRRGDEFGVVARAFNTMTARLHETLENLRESEEQIAWRKKSEAEKQRLIDQLEVRNAEMERFAYTVSHDLKSPLITIRGFLGMLKKDAAAGNVERMNDDIERIHTAAGQMASLLDDVLQLSRIGRVVNEPQEVPLSGLVDEVSELLAGQLASHEVEVQVAPDLPVVFADRPRLLEVLQNLIDNAIKFSSGQPQPRIEIACQREGKETICYVRDNGVGIDPRYHEQIFGLFDRLDPKIEGTGVGLALVKRIIEVHGGRVWVESEGQNGQGSTFWFTLPGREAEPAEE